MHLKNTSPLTLPNISMPSLQHASRTEGKPLRGAPWRTKFFGLPLLAFSLPYVALLIWFQEVDVYHQHFSDSGIIVFAYNCFRVLFIFYLFWIVTTPGLMLLRTVARQELGELGELERLALGFFAGAGVWHTAMITFGYLDLYSVPIAVAVTLPLIVLSYVPARAAAVEIYRRIARVGRHRLGALDWLLLALIGIAFAALLLVKGLYPGGGHDYYTHYFYYFQSVIHHGGVWPNEVWYHYFYDKGDGLFFLGILLTDPLAPQLVTFTFMAAAALVIFLASRDGAPHTCWPWVAVVLFFAIYLYTPGWGEFEKAHELTTALVIAVFWIAAGALERCGKLRNMLWPVATSMSITTAVIVTPTIAVFLNAVFGLLSVWYLIVGERRRALLSVLFATIGVVLLAGTLAVNYATTGLITDQNVITAWPFSNLDKLDHWGALPMVIKLIWGRLILVAESLPLSKLPKLLIQSSRLDLIYPLIDSAAVIGVAALIFRSRSGRWADTAHIPHHIGILLAALPIFAAITLMAGRVQPVSFYRYSGFMVPLMIVVAIGLWAIPPPDSGGRLVRLVHDRRAPAVVLALSLLTIAAATPPARFFQILLPRASRFAVGAVSVDTAYTLQPPTPTLAVNAIYPGARGAYAVVGPGTPIWSMQYLIYCMLPDCLIETTDSFILPKWADVMFGSAEQARRALQSTGHNYFLISREFPLADSLPWSELFSPDNIARYLGIRWTDGTTSLLTWLNPGVRPLDQAWIANYRRAVDESVTVQAFPFEAMKQIFARLNATPHPWRPFPLPWQHVDPAVYTWEKIRLCDLSRTPFDASAALCHRLARRN
jgi:hypothetical protein